MMAVPGILFAEAVGREDKFWLAGTRDYPIPFSALVAIEAVTFGFLELKRYQGYKQTGSVSRHFALMSLIDDRRVD